MIPATLATPLSLRDKFIIWIHRLELMPLSILMITSYHRTQEEIMLEIEQVRKAQRDPKNFSYLYNKYFDSIFVYIFKRLGDEDSTSEVTAKVFFKCLQNIHKFRFQGVPFSAWLYKIAINEINSFFRTRGDRERIVSLDESHIHNLIDELDREEPEIDQHILISTLLEQLTPSEIQLIELRFFENNSFREIGYLLGISEGNAKIRTYRIVDKLKSISKQITFTEV